VGYRLRQQSTLSFSLPHKRPPDNGLATQVLQRYSSFYMDEATEFPDDANGDVLRRMQKGGDDLSKPRDVDFTLVFPSEKAALQFAEKFSSMGHKISVENSGTVPELPWDVLVVRQMALSHRAIEEFEEALEAAAEPLGGRNDCWGCFAQT
jgi:hypothetical protein